MRISVLFLLTILFSGSSRAAQPYSTIKVGPITGFLAGCDIGRNDMMTMFNDQQEHKAKWENGHYWQPNTKEAVEAEAAVRAYMLSSGRKSKNGGMPSSALAAYQNKGLAQINSQYSQYEVQFVGVFVDGRKRIFCNFFPSTKEYPGALYDHAPSQEIIYVLDGGSWFWQIEYVPSTRKCAELQINGRA